VTPLSYTVLYRKFRPGNFADVKGQDAIVTTLKNQLANDRIGHAYLFTGTRGTGKTSVAKIMAKAVNCEAKTPDGPCGQCAMCVAIQSGVSMNVREIDAASNNGVDNIRDIIDDVSYSPAQGKFKVYIIDEVHMLSTGAFNALLKTLEEPPSYCIFILATTEVHKLPITILSRCQRYDFKRITIGEVVELMQNLLVKEQVNAQEKALRHIAKLADGSVRDALSLLDQCLAFCPNATLEYDQVLAVLGAVDPEVFSRLLRAVQARSAIDCIRILEDVVMAGRELGQFVVDFTWYLRNLMLLSSSDELEEAIDLSAEQLSRLKEETALIELDQTMRYIRIFSELSGQIRYSSQKRILLEIALVKLCRPDMESHPDTLLDRIRMLEERVDNGITLPSHGENATQTTQLSSSSVPQAPKPTLTKAIPKDIHQIVSNWAAILSELGPLAKNYLKHAKLSLVEDDSLLICLPIDYGYVYYNDDPQHLADLQQHLRNYTGSDVKVQLQAFQETKDFDDHYPDLSKLIHMEIEIEE
jgi:DNA polymerase-3 subunit gamma/tau